MNAADIENRVLELNKKQESEDTAKAGFWEEFEVRYGDQQGDWRGVPGSPHPLSPNPDTDLPHIIYPVNAPLGDWCSIVPSCPSESAEAGGEEPAPAAGRAAAREQEQEPL